MGHSSSMADNRPSECQHVRSRNAKITAYLPCLCIVLALTALLGLSIWFAPSKIMQMILQQIVPEKPDWRYGFLVGGVIAFLMIIPIPIVVPIMFVPGMVFGFQLGVLIVFPAMFLGVTVSFILGRWAFQEPIREWIASGDYPNVQAVLKTLDDDEDAMVLLVLYRFLFGPFMVKNYAPVLLQTPLWKLSISAIPHHLWVSILFTSLGSIFKGTAELLRKGEKWDWKRLHWQQIALFVGSFASTGVITWYAYWIYRRKVAEHSEQTSEKTPLLHASDSTA
eukprot:TRINITY_DN14718_c0_g1_i1.p1 TRINITY_DN14718_c0_g1~~TRINITY_DN14718_c0_g1_i1.p1  ORF type:complete len:280 (-),score=27.28 TRINITY_DN14718_c0_g1_i1:173-1012(-)